jgi:hypothetical protein
MTAAVLIEPQMRNAVWRHLLPPEQEVEQAAFLYATVTDKQFQITDWEPLVTPDFVIQTSFHIELTDGVRARVIKRAHDSGLALLEIHSHLGKWLAQFSPSDLAGFQDWVPHVRWRLRGKPYGALVATHSGFDGLAWIDEQPVVLNMIVGGRIRTATGLSAKETYEKSI